MTATTVAGLVSVLALIICVGIYSGKKVKNQDDFLTGGGKGSTGIVVGALLGSLISSQSTIGSVQLAFHYGLTAWWFTLGSGFGCLLMGVGYVKALRRSDCVTELQVISKEYGSAAEEFGSVLNSLGIFITVLSQVMACIGLLTLMFPSMSAVTAAAVSIAIMCFYVIFGGAWGAGMGGEIKVGLLYAAFMGSMVYILCACGGVAPLMDGVKALLAGTPLGMVQSVANKLPDLPDAAAVSARFGRLMARGARDLGSGLSCTLGVLSTQTYAQAMWSAGSDATARKGALLGALLCPPLGIAGICIGLFMRAHYITAAEAAALVAAGEAVPDLPVLASTLQVLPAFAVDHLPPLIAGVVLGTLLITVVGGGAGLSLGMSAILVKDIFKPFVKSINTARRELAVTRATIAAVLAIAAVISVLAPGKMINDLGFLSMGLRAAVVFAPMTCALMLKGRIRSGFIVAAIILAPSAMIVGQFMKLPADSLMTGMAVSVLICLTGLLFPPKKSA